MLSRLDEQATLWSARLGVNARGLAKVLRGTTGTGLDSLSKEMRDAVDGDPIGRRARMRRQFVPRNPEDKTLKPGMLLLLDEFGPIEAPSVHSKHTQCIIQCIIQLGLCNALHTCYTRVTRKKECVIRVCNGKVCNAKGV